jgi:hypothetical protein
LLASKKKAKDEEVKYPNGIKVLWMNMQSSHQREPTVKSNSEVDNPWCSSQLLRPIAPRQLPQSFEAYQYQWDAQNHADKANGEH